MNIIKEIIEAFYFIFACIIIAVVHIVVFPFCVIITIVVECYKSTKEVVKKLYDTFGGNPKNIMK